MRKTKSLSILFSSNPICVSNPSSISFHIYIVLEFPFFSSHGEKRTRGDSSSPFRQFADTRTPSPTLTLRKIPSFQTTFEQTCLFPSLESIQKSTLPLDRILDRVKSRFESVTRSSKLESRSLEGGKSPLDSRFSSPCSSKSNYARFVVSEGFRFAHPKRASIAR